MERQADTAIHWATKVGLSNANILDVGCGTGWLGNALSRFGRVTGIDLSPDAIAEGARRFPDVRLLAGDFLTTPLPGQFDFVVSADALAHVGDQAKFLHRVAELLRPGGIFLLMTVNPFVWRHRSSLAPLERGQIRQWVALPALRALLRSRFTVHAVTSIVPGGDRGALWWVEHRAVLGVMGRLIGRSRWERLLERVRLGRELVVVARRI
jgi:2-polyprenyl-3-methyl-5-hydroxy-6-metoxy-1,4-benzoquinol methylase